MKKLHQLIKAKKGGPKSELSAHAKKKSLQE